MCANSKSEHLDHREIFLLCHTCIIVAGSYWPPSYYHSQSGPDYESADTLVAGRAICIIF